jgi:F420-dependent oxidoreductase-like protein
MRVAIGIGGPGGGQDGWKESVEFVREADRLGVWACWSAEAWGQDAVSPLAYLAAVTDNIRLGTGIMQISARAPSMTAMTALTMAALSNNRFILGLGASGPQVVEGLHGVRFAHPLGRLRETIDIIRLAFAGDRIALEGEHFTLPLPGGEGKALRLSIPGNENIPIYLATLSPRTLELTGEVADGWVGTSFIPEHADAFLPYMRAGAARAGRSLADVDLQAGGTVAFSDDVERLIAPRKSGLAFSLGAMGSEQHNFYNAAYQRAGWTETCLEVQRLWLDGKRDEAARRVPDEMVLQTNLLGTDDMVRDRLRAYQAAGITTLRVAPTGRSLGERVDTLARTIDLVNDLV